MTYGKGFAILLAIGIGVATAAPAALAQLERLIPPGLILSKSAPEKNTAAKRAAPKTNGQKGEVKKATPKSAARHMFPSPETPMTYTIGTLQMSGRTPQVYRIGTLQFSGRPRLIFSIGTLTVVGLSTPPATYAIGTLTMTGSATP